MIRDEMVDLALMVMVLGVVISVGLGLAVRAEQRAVRDSGILAEDKNTKGSKGYGIDGFGSFDDTLTGQEVILMMQVQDYYMSEPKKVTVIGDGGARTDIDILSTYKEELVNYGIQVYSKLYNFNTNTRYDVRFSRGLLIDDSSDDTYVIKKSNN